MANPERGEVDLIVGDREFILSLTTNDLCGIQARTGKTYGDLVLAMTRFDVMAIRDLLWTGLQRHHAKEFKKQADVGPLLDELGGFMEAIETLRQLAVVNQRPAAKKGASADPLEAQPGTSEVST